MKADYVHKDSLTSTDYDDFIKAQNTKESILNDTEDYGRTQFVDEIYKLQQENQQLKIQISAREEEYRKLNETNKVLSQELTKDKILKQDHLTTCCGIPIGDIPKFIDKYNKQKEIIDKAINELYEFRKSHCIEEDTECKEITHILETLGVEKEEYIQKMKESNYMNKEQVLIDNFDKLGEEYKQKEFERIAKENARLNEIIDKIRKEVNKQYTIMGCEVVENWVLLQILEDKEV